MEVCPTGVFTDKSLKRHYARKWDLQTAPSICEHCGLGCNMLPGERYGTLRRIMPRYNGQVNGYFLCDRGRYGYEYVNSAQRIRQPLRRKGTALEPVTRDDALQRAAEILRTGMAIGIGSPRASLESNYALRALVGPDRFFLGVPEPELRLLRTMVDLLRNSPARTPSLREVESCDTVLILGEDPANAAPLLDLALRQAVLQQPRATAVAKLGIYPWLDECLREAIQDDRGPLFIATPDQTKLDRQAAQTYRAAPDDIARLGFAVAHALDPSAPAVPDIGDAALSLAQTIAAGLKAGKSPLVLSGPSCGSVAVVQAAAGVAAALCKAGVAARLCYTAPECNSLGAAMLPGGSLDDAATTVRTGTVDNLIVLENDLHRRLGPTAADALLAGVRHVIVLDHLNHATSARAEIVLPAATFAESSGTLISNEGRAQRFFQVFVPQAEIQPAWRWIGALFPQPDRWPRLDDLIAGLAADLPVFAAIVAIAPPADFRSFGRKIPRQASRYSGRTAITAHLDVHEPQPPDDSDSPLAFSMEGAPEAPPPLIARFWAPQWNSIQALNKFQMEVGGPLRGGDPGRRLIEPVHNAAAAYATEIPAAFAARPDLWLVLPAWHIHGSEELSVHSPGVAELAPKPYVALNARDMARLGLREGEASALSIAGRSYTLPVVAHPALPDGVALVPAGLPDLPGVPLPAWGRLTALAEGATP